MLTPTITGYDGSQREKYIFNTTISDQFFSGELPTNTIDVQVSIRGAPFVSNPDFIVFEDTTWSAPNPSVYSNGFELEDGENVFLIRSISSTGEVSPPCEIRVTLVQESGVFVVASVPSNITMTRYNNAVQITCDGIDDPNVIGYNFRAATDSGGGATGYLRINYDTVIAKEEFEEEENLSEISLEEDVLLDDLGAHAADPLFFSLLVQQRDQLDTNLKETLVHKTEIPETASTVKASVQIKVLRKISRYSFKHYRNASFASKPPTIPNGSFSSLLNTDLLYYVVSAVYFDSEQNLQFESPYSVEVVGNPIIVTTGAQTLPQVSRTEIRNDFSSNILRNRPSLRIEPNSVVSDVIIQPFATEVERVRFILDFLHRSQSFPALLAIDDPTNSGRSQTYDSSVYKQALRTAFDLLDGGRVQAFIDSMFDQRAINYGVVRRIGRRAIGRVTLYVSTQPTHTIKIPLGTTVGGSFRTTQTALISVDNLASYYNPIQKRWEVEVTIEAISLGSRGNVSAGTIRGSSIRGVSAENSASTFGGQNLLILKLHYIPKANLLIQIRGNLNLGLLLGRSYINHSIGDLVRLLSF